MSDDTERYNVVMWKDGYYEYFLRNVSAERAMKAAGRCIVNLGHRGLVDKVAVTDEDDYTNFQWERDRGIVFPTRDLLRSKGVEP